MHQIDLIAAKNIYESIKDRIATYDIIVERYRTSKTTIKGVLNAYQLLMSYGNETEEVWQLLFGIAKTSFGKRMMKDAKLQNAVFQAIREGTLNFNKVKSFQAAMTDEESMDLFVNTGIFEEKKKSSLETLFLKVNKSLESVEIKDIITLKEEFKRNKNAPAVQVLQELHSKSEFILSMITS